ncbi:26003_t:CDS:2, partial [Gigaspora margarita]
MSALPAGKRPHYQLDKSKEEVPEKCQSIERKLSSDTAHRYLKPKTTYDEKTFKWKLNEDPMATEKLSEGIRQFAKDSRTLMFMLRKCLINEATIVNENTKLFGQTFQE